MNAYGIAPCSRIHATAQHVSSPPENAMPTRSPTGSEARIAPPLTPARRRSRSSLQHVPRISSASSAPVVGSRATSRTVFSPAIVPAMRGCRATSIACASAFA